MLNASTRSVFHVALVVFATIQIHETKGALVQNANCDYTVSYVVSVTLGCLYCITLSTHPLSVSRAAVAVALCGKRWNIYCSPSLSSSRHHGLL